jgi:signal-transduction protein with cAMP-binding, CBS, and nucleotidyltransferase domain
LIWRKQPGMRCAKLPAVRLFYVKEMEMRVADICTRRVVTCGRDANAQELAKLMRDCHVGDVIVVDAPEEGRGRPVGIVTDRDLVVQVMAQGVAPELVRAGDLMKDKLVTVEESELVFDAIWHMRGQGVRRLPVVDVHRRLVGVITADDITAFLASQLTETARIAPHEAKLEQAARQPLST